MKNTTFVLITWLGFSICGHCCNPLRFVGSRSKEQALPQSHKIICSHQWSKRESFPLDRHWIYKTVCNKFREHILRVFFQLTVLDMPVISAYLPGEFHVFSVFFSADLIPMESQYGDLSSEERVEVADFHTRALASVEMSWNVPWIDLSGNLEIPPPFFFLKCPCILHFKSDMFIWNFRINWIFQWIWSIPPIGVSLQDDINSLVSKIGDPPQFPAFRSQQWIKSDFVRESQRSLWDFNIHLDDPTCEVREYFDEVNTLKRIVGEYLVNMFALFVEVNKVNSSVTKEDLLFSVEAGVPYIHLQIS